MKNVGFIGFKDPYGENWHKVFSSLAEKAGVQLIATEYYQRTDPSVTGQALKLVAAKPDAILIAGVGGPAVLPQTTLRDQGYKGPVYQTHGVATDDFIRLGKEKVGGTVLAAGPMLVIDAIPDADPIQKVAQNYIAQYEKQFGQKPATFGMDQDDYVLMPLTAFQRRIAGTDDVGSIAVSAISEHATTKAKAQLEVLMRERRRIAPSEPDDFSVQDMREISDTWNPLRI